MLEGARTAVAHGLAPEAALAAMTRTPAELFGIPHVPRLEPGLPATFIVTTGPLFDEDARVAYTFVEGLKEDGAKPGGAAGEAAEAASFDGEWAITLHAEDRILRGTLTIEQDGATFTGTLELEETTMRVRDGRIDGAEITAVALMRQGDETVEVEIEGTVRGDEATGQADAGPLGVTRWTARRQTPGGAR